MYYGASPEIKHRARILRDRMTKEESLLWGLLRNNQLLGMKFRRQHPINSYIVDFYCHSAKLVIEVDGDSHSKKEQIIHDEIRTQIIEEFGIKVLRFSNYEILSCAHDVFRTLKNALVHRTPNP